MAIGIYAGAGGVKTVSGIYVGAGGVKTVTAVYVGAGSVKQVWPAYIDGQELFEISTDYWTGYERYYSSGITGWEAITPIQYSSYLRISWYGLRLNCGCFFVTKQTINASAINYIGTYFSIDDSWGTTVNGATYTMYASVATSASSSIVDDTGVATSDCLDIGYRRQELLDLRSCTRTGYLKIGVVVTGSHSGSYNSTGYAYLYNAVVGSTTSASDYGLSAFQDTLVIK